MSITVFRLCLSLSLSFALPLTSPAQAPDDEDLNLIELEGFEVFSNSVKVIDGITGEEYAGKHPVALGFRRDFDTLLLSYHKRLLLSEYKKLQTHIKSAEPLKERLHGLLESFGFEGKIRLERPRLTREMAIFNRMMRDPFFKIEELVVWDLNGLRINDNTLPNNKYARHIRFNEETQKWERRVIAKWKVTYSRRPQSDRVNIFHTFKEQGLNLDSNKGFHLIDVGLPADVPPHAFSQVDLQYPIFVDTVGDVDAQVRELSRDFIENLYYIYDPFSWVARGNTRFHYGYPREMQQILKAQRIEVTDPQWFERVLANFLNDIALLEHWSPDVIYAKQMASASRKNRNVLGEDLDLLNWQKKEKRKVNFDPTVPNRVPHISFDSPGNARYVLLDAYRRYGDKFVEAMRKRVLAIEEKVEGKQLVREALEEASGVPAEKYIPAAIRAQKAELKRFLRN